MEYAMKILIVDDSEFLLKRLVKLVQDLGHEVSTAMSGSEAYRQVQLSIPMYDVIITDMQMKYGTGLELIERLYLDSREIPCRLQSSEDYYIKEGKLVNLDDAVEKYSFASYAPKDAFGHIEKFLAEVEEKQKSE